MTELSYWRGRVGARGQRRHQTEFSGPGQVRRIRCGEILTSLVDQQFIPFLVLAELLIDQQDASLCQLLALAVLAAR